MSGNISWALILTSKGMLRRAFAAGGIAAVTAIALATTAFAAEVTIVTESFTHATTTSSAWVLPTAPVGTNGACLTASSNASETPIPGCALPTPDANDSGALRLTNAGKQEEGGVAFGQALPTIRGLDVTFNSYQYGGSGADGIGFFLAATNPTSPDPPSTIGAPGGALGYSPDARRTPAAAGLADGYLGIGIDVFGNYSNSLSDGTGCTDPSWMGASTGVPGQVTVRGPGNGLVGYCPLNSSAATDSKLAQALDGGLAGTRVASKVPVEIAINPGGSSVTTTSGLMVPAGDYAVAFTPIGGSPESFYGALPTTSNHEIPTGTIPTAWTNPTTGVPYELTMGWVGSTGGLTDIHEITEAAAASLSGKLPGLAATLSAHAAQTQAASTYILHVSTTASGGPETESIVVTDTFPSSVTPYPSGAGGIGWVCSVTGQRDTCTYAVITSALGPGTALPPLSMPVTVNAPAGTRITDSARVSSDDVSPVSVSAAFVVPGTPVPSVGAAQPSLTSVPLGLMLILAGSAVAGFGVGSALRRSPRQPRAR
jgi:hypothetical protein